MDVWANRCYLRAFEGQWEAAEAQCLGGIASARSGGDERRAIAMTSVLAGLRALAGQARKAVNLHEDAAQRYDQLGAVQDAAGERARAIMLLAEGRHLDEALRLLERLDQKRAGQPRHPLVEEARQRLALTMLLSSFESSEEEEVRAALQNIGAYLFETRRAVSLSELSLLYLDVVFRSGAPAGDNEDLQEAVSAIVNLERELGLERSGWVGAYAQARLHIARGEREPAVDLLLAALNTYEQRLLLDASEGDSLRVWMGRGQARFYRRPAFELHNRLLEELRALNREEEAAEIERRIDRLGRAILWRQPAAAKALRPQNQSEKDFVTLRSQRVALERHLVEVSLDGGETPPSEQRAAVGPLLTQLRTQEAASLSALSPDRQLLFSLDLPPVTGPRADAGWVDLSAGSCWVGGRRGADVFLKVTAVPDLVGSNSELEGPEPGLEILGPAELADQNWKGVVLLSPCPDGEEPELAASLALQEPAFFAGGATAVVRQIREVPRRARNLFHSSLKAAVLDGLPPEEAFQAARDALGKRWRREQIRSAWLLKTP